MDENAIYAKTLDDQRKWQRQSGSAWTDQRFRSLTMRCGGRDCNNVDDAMFVLQDEATEDISITGSVSPVQRVRRLLFRNSVFRHATQNSLWLMLLMLSATVTGDIGAI